MEKVKPIYLLRYAGKRDNFTENCIVCNAVDGERYEFGEKSEDFPLPSKNEDVTGPLDDNKLIYFKYKLEPELMSKERVQSQLRQRKMSPEEAKRVWAAYELEKSARFQATIGGVS
ncbi:MAG: hypothetical protein WC521_03470 [Bdellovibrionales bacterium]